MNKAREQLASIVVLLVCTGYMIFPAGCGNGASSSNTPPTASFTASPNIGSYPLTVSFDASPSMDSDGTITRYDWQFGDGGTAVGSAIQHTYTAQGTFTARLTVTDNSGGTGILTTQIEVKPQYTLSGAVYSAGYMTTDSDVNDTQAPYASNDTFSLAQALTAPVSVSGYVNLARLGNMGRSYFVGDPNDYYAVTMDQGTDVNLFMAEDPSVSELGLYLYQGTTQIDATFTDTTGTASLLVPADGTYYIRVEAADYAGLGTATVYVLNIGNKGSAVAGNAPRLSDDFVPGEVLVRFDDTRSASSEAYQNVFRNLTSTGLHTDASDRVRDKLWTVPGNRDRRFVSGNLGVAAALDRSLMPGREDPEKADKMETLWMVRALRRTPGVLLAEPNYVRRGLIVEPNDTYYSYQWHYPLIGLPEAWDITTGSSNVIVAVIDSGILKEHPDISGQLVAGYDFVSDAASALDGDGVDPDPEDPGDGDIGGSSFHGTHIAGTIAAHTNNNTGVAGIAWNARIMPLRVLGKGGKGTTNDILEAVRYAAGMETNAGLQLAKPVDIINLSLGGTGHSQIEEAVFQEAHDRGVIVVASAGNNGTSEVSYPAGYGSVVSVSAITIEGKIASYSSFGPTIDVAAPGGSSTDLNGDGYLDGVLSTVGDDRSGTVQMSYAFFTGTSMAAPHVSGVAALMKSIYPAMTPANFDAMLAAGYLTQSGDTLPNDTLGYGIIDAYKAVLVAEEAAASGQIPPVLAITPRVLNFGSAQTNLSVTVQNGGDGSLALGSYNSGAPWLTIAPSTDVDGNGFGTYDVTVARDGLSQGIYTADLTFEAGTQAVQVSVIMQVGFSSSNTGGGYHYILLIDPASLNSIYEASSSGINGRYSFHFAGLRYGDSYLVYAGTDPNNDYSICTQGEACGAYLSLDMPAKLTIGGDVENVDFTTDIQFNIPNAPAGLSTRNANRSLPNSP
jgi:serine protease